MNKQKLEKLINNGNALLGQKKNREALDVFLEICKHDPGSPQAYTTVGNIYGALGQYANAEKYCRKALKLDSSHVNAHANLGNALMAQGKPQEAAGAFEDTVRLQPMLAPAWYMLGNARQQLNQWPEAEKAFRQVISLKPDWLDAYVLLGNVLQSRGNFRAAVEQYKYYLRKQPGSAEAHYRLSVSLSSMGQLGEAETHCRKALEIQPDHVSALNSLTLLLSSQGRIDEALECCQNAREIRPEDINSLCLAAHLEEARGRPQAAYELLKPCIDSKLQDVNLALAFASVSTSLNLEKDAISMMENLLEQASSLTSQSCRNLRFNLGKLCDRVGQYDRAFMHYQKGNELPQARFDRKAHAREIDQCIEIQSSDFFRNAPVSGNRSDRPVFIVGMPRSGTSLVEQILASHPRVHGAGELTLIGGLARRLPEFLGSQVSYPQSLESVTPEILEQCAAEYLQYLDGLNGDSDRVTDKMPGNFYFLGFIELLFPNARVIHCTRSPLDTCLSCYFQDFFDNMSWCYDQQDLVAYYRGYQALMDHWKQVLSIPILDVSYEQLVSDQEAMSRKLVDFCGLEWSDDCLEFHRSNRFVSTASYDQVREPIYNRSVARWKHYREHIEPLIRELGEG